MNYSLCIIAFVEFAEFNEFIDSVVKAQKLKIPRFKNK